MSTLKLTAATAALWALYVFLIYVALALSVIVWVAAIIAAPFFAVWCAGRTARILTR